METDETEVRVIDVMAELRRVELSRIGGVWTIRLENDVGSVLVYSGQREECLHHIVAFAGL